MSNNDWHFIANKAKSLVNEAAQQIKKSLKNERIVEYKSNPNDLVTEMDKQIESFFDEEIKKEFPSHLILGEEGAGKEISTLDGTVWIIDPIDGTTNFVHQQRHFAISVGIYEDGVGKVGIIFDVMADELFMAVAGEGAFLNGVKLPSLNEAIVKEALIAVNSGWIIKDERLISLVRDCRGTRAYGAAAIEMASVCANRTDAYISLNLSPWDFAAGAILIKELGGKITTVEGNELNLLKPSSICVAKPGLYEQLQSHYFNRK
ncbi:inositol monophosphatase family protein [Anaerobacillus isosaccharinicus]|uniref:inositol-phosphate phosphatase n=1 Tax=Anaerobacillus isosaccharinicus TaxID=1532552 RepID=A0A1S2M7D8_9BACI|nr:inositol monophosphatase family protein [Anaerobacillus isosaccharinicus]MBA5587496.1 inositol monophosphatase family protein [Anaerobacillus isosaccharinicus]QOY34322.1 inositol monophosphatase family protein [Anaerobacillus isosaccharinicus]